MQTGTRTELTKTHRKLFCHAMLNFTKFDFGKGNSSVDEAAILRGIDIYPKKYDCFVGNTESGVREPFYNI